MKDEVLSKEEMIRDEVVATAQKLFQHYGSNKTTMEDIAKAMGKGKSTLYYYYKSKDEIFEAVILKEAKEVMSTVFEATEKAVTAEEKLRIYLSTSFRTIKNTLNLYAVMKNELLESSSISFYQPSMRKALQQFNSTENMIVKDILMLGIDNKEFSASLKEDIGVVAYVVLTGLRSIAVDLVFDEKEETTVFLEENKLNAMINILIKGLKD